jgi:hypothetical protein
MATDALIEAKVAELNTRSKRWFTRARKLGIYTGVAVGLALTSIAFGSLLGPSSSLGNALDVPAQVASAIGTTDVVATDALGITTTTISMFQYFKPIAVILAIFGLFLACFKYLVGMTGAGRTFVLIGAGTAMLVITISVTKELGDSDRSEEVAARIEASAQATTAAGLYVRAQAALRDIKGDDKKLLKTAADAVQGEILGFDPDPEVLYLIEKAAYGKAHSPAAVEYSQPRIERRDVARGISRGLFLIGFVQGAIALSFSGLGWLLGRRLRRVKLALGASNASNISDAVNSVRERG